MVAQKERKESDSAVFGRSTTSRNNSNSNEGLPIMYDTIRYGTVD